MQRWMDYRLKNYLTNNRKYDNIDITEKDSGSEMKPISKNIRIYQNKLNNRETKNNSRVRLGEKGEIY